MTRRGFWLLAGANFAVALGYGAILPLLPTMLLAAGAAWIGAPGLRIRRQQNPYGTETDHGDL